MSEVAAAQANSTKRLPTARRKTPACSGSWQQSALMLPTASLWRLGAVAFAVLEVVSTRIRVQPPLPPPPRKQRNPHPPTGHRHNPHHPSMALALCASSAHETQSPAHADISAKCQYCPHHCTTRACMLKSHKRQKRQPLSMDLDLVVFRRHSTRRQSTRNKHMPASSSHGVRTCAWTCAWTCVWSSACRASLGRKLV